jgi:hypothetical protein
LYTSEKSLRTGANTYDVGIARSSAMRYAVAHPGFFSLNIEGRCAFKNVEVQMKRSTHVRNDWKFSSADCVEQGGRAAVSNKPCARASAIGRRKP